MQRRQSGLAIGYGLVIGGALAGALVGAITGALLFRDDNPESDFSAGVVGFIGLLIGVALGLVAWLVRLWQTGSTLALPATVPAVGVLALSLFFALAGDGLPIWLVFNGVVPAAACALLVATLWRAAASVMRAR